MEERWGGLTQLAQDKLPGNFPRRNNNGFIDPSTWRISLLDRTFLRDTD